MFKFEEGMYVKVYRTSSIRGGEIRYSSDYPRLGWIGQLIRPRDERPGEWKIRWDQGGQTDYIREWNIIPIIVNRPILIGDKVIYISNRHGDSLSNPLWNGVQDKIYGTVVSMNNASWLKVEWDYEGAREDIRNDYSASDLYLAEYLAPVPKRNIKKHIDELCDNLYKYNPQSQG